MEIHNYNCEFSSKFLDKHILRSPNFTFRNLKRTSSDVNNSPLLEHFKDPSYVIIIWTNGLVSPDSLTFSK